MRTIIITLLFCLSCSVCFAAIPQDKALHFSAGYIINDQLTQHTHLTWLERQGVVLLIAYAKERTDAYVDKRDIAATMLGSLVYTIRF